MTIDKDKLRGYRIMNTEIRDPLLVEQLAIIVETQRIQNQLYQRKKQDTEKLTNNLMGYKIVEAYKQGKL